MSEDGHGTFASCLLELSARKHGACGAATAPFAMSQWVHSDMTTKTCIFPKVRTGQERGTTDSVREDHRRSENKFKTNAEKVVGQTTGLEHVHHNRFVSAVTDIIMAQTMRIG